MTSEPLRQPSGEFKRRSWVLVMPATVRLAAPETLQSRRGKSVSAIARPLTQVADLQVLLTQKSPLTDSNRRPLLTMEVWERYARTRPVIRGTFVLQIGH